MTEDDVKRLVVIRDYIAGRTRFEDQRERERADEFLLRLLDEERAARDRLLERLMPEARR